MKYRKNQDVGLFDKENTLQELLENGTPLPKLKEIIDFERFRDILEPVFENTGKKSNAGRKPIDPVFMFKVLFLQRLYGMSDAQIEYHIKDRTSFRDFLGNATHARKTRKSRKAKATNYGMTIPAKNATRT